MSTSIYRAKLEEDQRTYAQYIKDSHDNITFGQYFDLRRMWRNLGGEFYGPNVEHGSMPESKLLPLLQRLQRLHNVKD